eukprot:1274831-Ditylum_brightwellii.AAC.1
MASDPELDEGSQVTSEEEETEHLAPEELELEFEGKFEIDPREEGVEERKHKESEESEEDIDPPAPHFGTMSTPAQELLGDDRVTIARTTDQFNVLEVI